METGTIPANLEHFSAMVAYPTAALPRTAAVCAAAIGPENAEAAAMIRGFADYTARTPLGRLEETYTSVFDLDPKCSLYVGYHLFGESYKRSSFLLGLNEHFAAQEFTPAGEVPDHLSILLRCLAEATDGELAVELITDALIPALDRMTGRVASPEHKDEEPPPPEAEHHEAAKAAQRAPYMAVLEALRLVLGAGDTAVVQEETRPVVQLIPRRTVQLTQGRGGTR